jgi:hypothetical protein
MDYVIKYLQDHKYKFINVTMSIKHHSDIVNFIQQKRLNIVLYIVSNDKTKDILKQFHHGTQYDCLLIFNGKTASLQLSKPIIIIDRQIDYLLNTKVVMYV